MPGTSKLAQGAWSWVADFTGPGLIFCWGGGESGESGQALTRGGAGGDGGWLCIDLQNFVTGTTYTGYNGAGGARVSWSGGSGHPSNPGEASYFGGGTTCKAPGGGDTTTVPQGRAKIPGAAGAVPVGADWNGGKGGDAPTSGNEAGGAGGTNGTQSYGNPGSVPGGGGSGGGQASGGDGAPGANGGCIIVPAADVTLPGYYIVGMDENYANFSAVGTFDDFTPNGDGTAYFEAVGSGGGGRGGASLQGGHGGAGGAHMWRLRQVFKDVTYRRTISAAGTGGVYSALGGTTSGTAGGDSSWTLTPLRVIQKQLTSNVATLWTYDPSTSNPKKHGLLVGESVTIAGVDSTFNGTYTVTAVAADRLSFSYAKTAANVGATAVTPAGTSVGLTNPFLLAKGGAGATGNYNTGTVPTGGQVSGGIGDGGTDGGFGCKVRAGGAVNTTDGGGSGGGGLPLGGDGVWGGGDVLNSTGGTSKVGDTGKVPGGGGGGGAGSTGGNGGPGARGCAVVRWILELHGIWVGGERKSVTRVKVWSGGVANTVTQSSVWYGGAKKSTHRVLNHPESLKRSFPLYAPDAYKAFFDRDSGTFNWKDGVGQALRTAFSNGDADIVVFGDSVSEGWTSFDGVATGTPDFPKAFPRWSRDIICGSVAYPSLAKGGTGLIRPASVSGQDPMWSFSGWSTSGTHYRSSGTTSHVATLTPALDSQGVQITGNKVLVVYSGGGITVKVNGTTVGTGAATANVDTLGRFEYTIPAGVGNHTIAISPTTTTVVRLFGASLHKTGLRIHNMSQGGAKAGGGTGQSYWGPATGMNTSDNMTYCYTQNIYPGGASPTAFIIFLGGNDSNAGSDAATIKAAFKRIVDAIQAAHPTSKIILMADVWTSDRQLALMDLCREEVIAAADFFYKSRGLSEIFGKGYNGDVFGHLNSTTGAPWAAGIMRDALVYNPS